MPSPTEADQRIEAALALLRKAGDYAADVVCDPWDFAVEIGALNDLGLDHADLRWLVSRGLVTHATETTLRGANDRTFQRTGKLTFTTKTCFILTDQGMHVARQVVVQNGHTHVCPSCRDSRRRPPPSCPKPLWDGDARQLSLNGVLVKQFRVPAPNQELILDAFQEEGWPTHLDDPLPPRKELVSKRRLHDVITKLNRCQENALIRFRSDGRGRGLCWEVSPEVATPSPPDRR